MKQTLLIIAVVMGQAVCAAGTVLSKERPNILFIFSDDHSFEAVSA